MTPHVFIAPVLMAVIGLVTGVAMAATPPVDIAQRLAALEAKVTALETELAAIKSSQVMALNQYLTVTTGDMPRALFSGLNLQLVNGTGQTDSSNGRGNLLLGYDLARHDEMYFCADGQFTGKEPCERYGHAWAVSHKTGSHYLVIGDRNNYAQYGGLVVGLYNTSIAPAASVSGGMFNTARAPAATVTGGRDNKAAGLYGSVSGEPGTPRAAPTPA